MSERKQTVVLRPVEPYDAQSCNGCTTGEPAVKILEVGNGQSGYEWRMGSACLADFNRSLGIPEGKDWTEVGQHI